MDLNKSVVAENDKSNDSGDSVELDESRMSVTNTSLAEPPTTPGSAKMCKALKTQIRMEMEKKRKEEREKQEQAKLERNKQREEQKKKREEEERERKQKQEEIKKKKEEERLKKEEEERERKRKLEEQKKKREEEKAKKEAEELEKKKKLEEAKQKREEEKERQAKEKAEKERQRIEQLNAKNEEKKKKEEERIRKEEEERRKTEKLKITSYFVKKESSNPSDRLEKVYRFMPFEPKPNMTIAPLCRRVDLINMSEDEHSEYIHQLDEQLLYRTENDDDSMVPNYLEEIRKNPSLIRRACTSFRKSEKKDLDVKEIIVSNKTKFKVKYLHFDRKVFKRPPYYGTWRKESDSVKPRRPFGKDTKLDYDVDSDDEWEDEPEGESINGSSDVEDEEEADDDEDDGFFVPHGYLSDEELDEEEREMNMEEKKAKHALKVQQYELESRRGKRVLVPKCFIDSKYLNPDCEQQQSAGRSNLDDIKMLERLQMVPMVSSLPIVATIENECQKVAQLGDESTPKAKGHKGEGKSKQSAANKQATPVVVAAANASAASATSAAALPANTASPTNNTPSIIKFISKMSNKNIKIEHLGGSTATTSAKPTTNTDESAAIMIVDEEPVKKETKIEVIGIDITSSPVVEVKKLNESCSENTVNTPLLAKSSHMPEKRACTDKTENKIVKRLKLDSLDKSGGALSKSEQKKGGTHTPSVVDLFKVNACKRALKLNDDETSTTNASTSGEAAMQTLANGDSKLNTVMSHNSPSKKLRETKTSSDDTDGKTTDKENTDAPSPIIVE